MEGTIGEIRMFAGNFAPNTWAFCAGQLMSISQNTALFSILGTTYGGNGQTTFALPDFRGRYARGTGQGPGLTNITLGEVSGVETVTLLSTQMPAHTHTATATAAVQVNNDNSNTSDDATGKRFAATEALFTTSTGDLVNMAPSPASVTINPAGNSQPVPVINPYLGMNYIICLFGIFPSRN